MVTLTLSLESLASLFNGSDLWAEQDALSFEPSSDFFLCPAQPWLPRHPLQSQPQSLYSYNHRHKAISVVY